MIKKVEIILAPGASFSSSSGAGIVNIITADIYEGWLGSARASVSLNNGRPAPQIEAGGSYSGKKFNVSALVLLASDGFPMKSNSRYDFHTTGTTIETSTKDRGHSERLRALFSAGYSFSSRTRLEGRLSISGNSAHYTYNSRSLRREADGSVTESFSDRVMWRSFRAPGVDFGLALFQKFGPKGSELQIRASASYMDTERNTDYNNDGDLHRLQNRNILRGISAKAKYDLAINERNKLSIGYYFGLSRPNDLFIDGVHSNHFLYSETENDIFANFNCSLPFGLDITAGLRMEHSDIDSHLVYPAEYRYRNSRWDWSPNISLSYRFTPRHSIMLEVRRNIPTPDRQPESVCRSDRLLPLPAGKSHSAPAAVL